MTEEGISRKFRLNKIEINYFIKEICQNELISNKHKNICMTLNYSDHLFSLVFAVNGCISISAFASLVSISTGIMSSTIGLNICAIVARIKWYKSIIKKKKKKHDEKSLLAKIKLNCIKFLGF